MAPPVAISAKIIVEVLTLEISITFAEPQDEEKLRDLLLNTDMDLAGEIEEHVVVKRGSEVLAGGCLYQADEDLFHLLVFAVDREERGRGLGQRLLRQLSASPWKHCRGSAAPGGGSYRITTVARGEAAGFYRSCGYQACEFLAVPVPFDSQCEECPERMECKPLPLVFEGER